jgi:hypothetical protein
MRPLERALHRFVVVVGATFFRPSSASAVNSITQATSISGNQTLFSAGGIFQLGFFVPEDGKTYLGIWYANIPDRTVVWVANRQRPFVHSPGVFRLTADGSLAVLDSQNATVWSSSAGGADAQLYDNGNFVLMNTDGSVAWQSFDHPSDTLLPGMKLGVTGRARITSNITSWKTPSDPSPGDYTFKLVLGGMPEFFLVQGGTTRTYGSGPFNGELLTGVPYLQSNDDFKFKVVSTPDETYYSYTIGNASWLWRFVVNGTGKLQRYVWETVGGAATGTSRTTSASRSAAANVGGGVSRDCVIWDVDLLDMRQFPTVLQDATPQVLTTFTPISFDFSLNSACSSYRN